MLHVLNSNIKPSIVVSSYLPMVMVFAHDEHWKYKIANKPSLFFILIVPFQRLPQPSQFVLHIRVNNTWFCKIEYPSRGTFEFEFVDVNATSNFILFGIFCSDGKDGRFKVVNVFDVVFDGTFWRACFTKERLLFLVEKPCLL